MSFSEEFIPYPLQKSNDCHNPSGSPEGGRFCSTGATSYPTYPLPQVVFGAGAKSDGTKTLEDLASMQKVVKEALTKIPEKWRIGNTTVVINTIAKSTVLPKDFNDKNLTLGVTDTESHLTEVFYDHQGKREDMSPLEGMKYTTVHEYGHNVDYALGLPAREAGTSSYPKFSSQHFAEIDAARKSDLKPYGDMWSLPMKFWYAMSSPSEAFAETFRAIVLNDKSYLETLPALTAVVKGWLPK